MMSGHGVLEVLCSTVERRHQGVERTEALVLSLADRANFEGRTIEELAEDFAAQVASQEWAEMARSVARGER